MSNPIFTTTSEEFAHASNNYDVVPVRAVIESPRFSPINTLRKLGTERQPSLAIAYAEATHDHYWRSDDQSSPEIPQPATMQLISD